MGSAFRQYLTGTPPFINEPVRIIFYENMDGRGGEMDLDRSSILGTVGAAEINFLAWVRSFLGEGRVWLILF